MKRYNCTLSDKRGAFGLCMEEHKDGAFVTFSEVGPLNQRINQLLEERNSSGLAISNAILVGVVPDKHPLRSRLELLANHRKMLIEKSELCDDLLDLIERMVNCMGLAGEEPEKDSCNPIKAWMYDAISTMAGQRPKQSVAVTETIRTAPERIWLQVGDQRHYHSEPFPSDTSEVSWCSDSVVGCEVPYVRADLAGHVVSQPLGLLIQMTDILKMCRSALITAHEDVQDGTGKGVIQYRIKLATKAINMAEHAIDAAAKANSGRLIAEGQELELITVLQSIVNGFSDDPAHDAAALLKRITGEVPWAGDSFQLPPHQGGEQCNSASPSSSPA